MIKLSVLIPTHGRAKLLGRTLASLANCSIPEGYVETVVIENGPKSGAEDTVAAASSQWPHLKLRYLRVSRANKSHALNEALRSIDGGLALFFDDDLRFDREVIEAYASMAATSPRPSFFGGPLRSDFEETPSISLLALFPESVRGFSLSDAAARGFYLGANWAAYVDDLLSLGGFDSEYGPGSPKGLRGQESEMQGRLRAAGYAPVDVPRALVWHYVPRERCTTRWLLRRSWSTGLGVGAKARHGKARREFGAALRTLSSLPARLTSGLFRGDTVKCIATLQQASYYSGYLRGYIGARGQGLFLDLGHDALESDDIFTS